jgi:hypothetical protein
MSVKARIAEELSSIQQRNGGILRPADVVDFAKNEETALHSQFTWDDSEAATNYRLWQARAIIRLSVTIIGTDTEPVRALVSLSTDRTRGGGYRSIEAVMADEADREQLLNDALMELTRAKRRYKSLSKLAPVWAALDEVTVVVDKEQKTA